MGIVLTHLITALGNVEHFLSKYVILSKHKKMITAPDPIRKTLQGREGGSCFLKCGIDLVGEIEDHCIRGKCCR